MIEDARPPVRPAEYAWVHNSTTSAVIAAQPRSSPASVPRPVRVRSLGLARAPEPRARLRRRSRISRPMLRGAVSLGVGAWDEARRGRPRERNGGHASEPMRV